MILLERSFGSVDLKKYQRDYSLSMKDAGAKVDEDMPAFLVIKHEPITKASRKKSHHFNWKVNLNTIKNKLTAF